MKTLLQIEMYYVREYTPTRWLFFKNLQLECILHYITVLIDEYYLCHRWPRLLCRSHNPVLLYSLITYHRILFLIKGAQLVPLELYSVPEHLS